MSTDTVERSVSIWNNRKRSNGPANHNTGSATIHLNMKELDFTPHPILKPPTAAEQLWLLENNREGLLDLWEEHERLIARSKSDPLRYGFELSSWTRIREMLVEYNEVLVLGGNRSAKTTGTGKLAMESVTEQMDGHIVMFSQNSRHVH